MSITMQTGNTKLRREVRKLNNDMITVSSRQSLFIDDFADNQMRLVYIEDDSVYLVCRRGSELFFTAAFDREAEVSAQDLVEGDEPVIDKFHTPSYDSGWLDIEQNTLNKIEHGLGGELLRIYAYYKRVADGRIFPLNASFIQCDYQDHTGFDATDEDDAGIQFAILNDKEIGYSIQQWALIIYNHTDADGVKQEIEKMATGQLRILLYKTGATL